MGSEYKLSTELHGHAEDVRGVLACDLGVITSSRDKTVKVWRREADASYSDQTTLAGHTDFVSALAWLPPGALPELPNGGVVSGSRDTTAIVWDPVSAAPVQKLAGGHRYQVTGVAVLPGGVIATASLDSSIKLWRGGHCTATLEGHEGPVLALVATPEGHLLSGSGDCSVRRWVDGKCVQVYSGHTDSVRSLALLPGIGFVSGSHDATLRVWATDGQLLGECVGHGALVYSVAAAAEAGLLASGSEDNTVKVWRMSGECVQTLPHPGCVWAVAFTGDGDLVSGSSDAVARVWTLNPERQADAAAAAAYQEALQLKAAAAASGGASGSGEAGGQSGLPPGLVVEDPSVLAVPGTKDGATKFISQPDGSVAAYGWSAATATWDMIGTVTEQPEAGSISGGPKVHNGREWDFLVDVDMGSGPPLKLAMDRGENPHIVADRFLEQNDLPSEFKGQIVDFIVDNIEAPANRQDLSHLPVTGGFCDPFTGGGSADPGPPPAPRAAPSAPPAPFDITGGGVDPFTGSGRSGAGGSGAAAASQLPPSAYLLFDNPPPLEGLRKRVAEFSSQLCDSAEALSEAELAPGGALDQLLQCLAPACAGRGPVASELVSLTQRLLRWPTDKAFPGLDIARCLVLEPAAAAQLADWAGSVSTGVGAAAAAGAGVGAALAACSGPGAATAAQLTALRLACNCFKQPPLRAWLRGQRGALLDACAGAGGSKAVRHSLAVLLLNIAADVRMAGGRGEGAAEVAMQALSHLEQLLTALPPEEGEAALRAVTAVGSLAALGGDVAGVARDLGLAALVQRFAGGGGGLGEAVAQVAPLLR